MATRLPVIYETSAECLSDLEGGGERGKGLLLGKLVEGHSPRLTIMTPCFSPFK